MSEPNIFDKKPAVVELEPGTYYWCQCGHSKKQPYCDGSHKGTGMAPKAITLTEKQTVALCNCKRTKNAPKCDGTHKSL